MKNDQQEQKINRTTCFPLIGTVFFLIRPEGSRRLFFLSVGYAVKSKSWRTRKRISPTEWREGAHKDGRCYSFFRALRQAVCFVIISNLGFYKLLLQLGIFSYYFHDLLGNHSWHPCSLPEYVLVLLGTLFMSSGSCFSWRLRHLLEALRPLVGKRELYMLHLGHCAVASTVGSAGEGGAVIAEINRCKSKWQ